jgi:hypothetical protein
MSERLKESVLKTEVLIGIPGVRIPLHPRGHKFSLALDLRSAMKGNLYSSLIIYKHQAMSRLEQPVPGFISGPLLAVNQGSI